VSSLQEAATRSRRCFHEVYPPTYEQPAAWRKSAEPVVADWEAPVRKIGGDPKAILDNLRLTVAEHKATYQRGHAKPSRRVRQGALIASGWRRSSLWV